MLGSNFSVIITAGGIGKRMGSAIPKQFLPINGKPILLHTIEKFYEFNPAIQIVLTLPEDWKSYWLNQLAELNVNIPHQIVSGGTERYDSIKNALMCCSGDYIAVHDGVRPLINHQTLERCFAALEIYNCVIPIVPVKESLRKLDGENSIAVPRKDFVLVQTPQCFRRSELIRAYDQPFQPYFTDDASLAEACGYPIHLVEGNEENIKITTGTDLILAEHLLKCDK